MNQMNEMVERVAKAIIGTMFAPHELPIDDNLVQKYRETARAAIEAMREPTDEMCDAADWQQQSEVNQYQLAIDAALGTKK